MNPQAILGMTAHDAEQWLKDVTAGARTLSSDFNWEGLAMGAGTNAHACAGNAQPSEADTWAEIAVRVYERLAEETGDRREAFELSSMTIRAWMIARYGEQERHPVRDLSSLRMWFLETAKLSIEQAERKARDLRAIPFAQWSEQIDDVRALRAIKNRLNVFRHHEQLCVSPEIQRWISIWELLP